jgi:hypothetical protein
MQSVAKFLLGQYLMESKKNKFTGVLAHLADKSSIVLDESNFDDFAAHVKVFQYREKILMEQFVAAMHAEDSPNAFNENMGLALAVAHSHMDLQLVQLMQTVVAEVCIIRTYTYHQQLTPPYFTAQGRPSLPPHVPP